MGNSIDKKIQQVFKEYQYPEEDFQIRQMASGHINQTYRLTNNGEEYILQYVNTAIFKDLQSISSNISQISRHLQSKNYPHPFLEPLLFKNGSYLFDQQWRLFRFIPETITFEKVISAQQAFEVAQFLGEFYFYLKDMNPEKINQSIPGFLDFNQRFRDFEKSRREASEERLRKADQQIEFMLNHKDLLEKWNDVLPKFPERIIHADPKISNFLFDQNNPEKIKALIDWDTFMSGPILYDFGDMVRSYTNIKAEDDASPNKSFSKENYLALKKGFLKNLKGELTAFEIDQMPLAAKVVIYIQAIRFLTDYLNGDRYFKIRRTHHNLDRTQNQLNLLQEILTEENL